MKNKTNFERLDQNLIFVLLKKSVSLKVSLATIEPNDVNNLPSRPAIKTINSCTNNPINKQACFFFIF